ncbi:MAG: MobC family plasmid mobilization relaxosome protein [Coleofasciculaceae cyanobacterium]
MPKKPRPRKFLLCLSEDEWEAIESMAKSEGLTRSDLFRLKTIYRRLPRRTTTIAAQTYWQLARIGNNLNQLTRAVNSAIKQGWQQPPADPSLLEELKTLLNQVRRELVELDLIEQLDSEEASNWESLLGTDSSSESADGRGKGK